MSDSLTNGRRPPRDRDRRAGTHDDEPTTRAGEAPRDSDTRSDAVGADADTTALDERRADASTDTPASDDVDVDVDAATRIAQLERETERLRERYADARRTQHRQAALGLALVGGVAVAGSVLFPGVRSTLLVLGSIGLFGALLSYYLTPERFIASDVGERVAASLATNEAHLVGELGLQDDRVYVPVDGDPTAKLFVPQRQHYTLPEAADLERLLVVAADDRARGVAFTPTGHALFRAFDETRTEPLGESPVAIVQQLTDALVEGFELVESTDTEVDAAHDRVTVRLTGTVYGGADQFDNPAASLLAVGLANGLDRPVRVEQRHGETQSDLTVTCRWDWDDRTAAAWTREH